MILGFTVIRNKIKGLLFVADVVTGEDRSFGGRGSGCDHHPRGRGRRRYRVFGQTSVSGPGISAVPPMNRWDRGDF